MAKDIEINAKTTLAEIEIIISRLGSGPSAARTALIASERRSSYFKDIWSAIAVGTALRQPLPLTITAWGLQDWSKRDHDDSFALSHPALVGMQLGADILTDGSSPKLLDAAHVRRRIGDAGGVLGTGARQRTIVELEPHLPHSTPLATASGGQRAFFEFVREILQMLEIGAMARKGGEPRVEGRPKGTILEFLYELHTNAVEHGRAPTNARLLRLQKHQYPTRTKAMDHSGGFQELSDYLGLQPERPSNRSFNLVEASVSDFGPGILDGFLQAFAGASYRSRPRAELLTHLLHEQLSSKSDPNAGLGIRHALAAAWEMGAFVSLRTGEFWLVMRGGIDREPQLSFRKGEFGRVAGTHWQILLPDPTEIRSDDLFRA